MIPENYKKPIEYIRTPKPEVAGDELKIYAVKNRAWFDITDLFSSGVIKGVRTQTGLFVPTISGTTPVNLFQSNFAWLGSYNEVGRIINIRLTLSVAANAGTDVFFALMIGGITHATMMYTLTSLTNVIVEYYVTLGVSNSVKISGTLLEPSSGVKIVGTLPTIDMSVDKDVYINGNFGASSVTNVFSVSQVTVEVI